MNWQTHKTGFLLLVFMLLQSVNISNKRDFEIQTRFLPDIKKEWPRIVTDSISAPDADKNIEPITLLHFI